MIKKAVVMRKHLEVNRKDKDGKFRLILVESRIHRLARYYKVSQDPVATCKFCMWLDQVPLCTTADPLERCASDSPLLWCSV